MNKPHKEISKRRKEIVKLLRQQLTPQEIADRLDLDLEIVYADKAFIDSQKAETILKNQSLLENLGEAQLMALHNIDVVDAEAWKIYYSAEKDSITQLQALEKIRQNTLDRAKILKVLSSSHVQIDKVQVVYQSVLNIVTKIVDAVSEFVPKEKQIEMLQKLHALDIEKEVVDLDGKSRFGK